MSDNKPYTITDTQTQAGGVLTFACTIPGTIVCGMVLIAYGLAALAPSARKCFDRVSFRLLVYSMVFNVLFGIAYAATPTSHGVGCNVKAFAVNFTLSFATFSTTCIALNLLLVLAYGFDGNKLEKYYLAGTTILSIVLNVPTMALGQFGWNESIVTCWYSNANDEVRLRWVIGTRSFWISLAATIEAVCSGGTPRMFSFFIDGISPKRQIKSLKAAGTDVSNGPSQFSGTSVFTQDPRYRTVILRIALYPMVSLFMNFSTVILDLNMSVVGVHTQMDFRLLVLDVVLYGLRTLAYGVLAAGDPSFINAVRKIRKSRGNRSAISGTVLTGISFASITAAPERSQSESNVKDGPDRKVEVFDVRLPETSSATTAWKDSVETGGAVAGAEIEREMEKFARQL